LLYTCSLCIILLVDFFLFQNCYYPSNATLCYYVSQKNLVTLFAFDSVIYRHSFFTISLHYFIIYSLIFKTFSSLKTFLNILIKFINFNFHQINFQSICFPQSEESESLLYFFLLFLECFLCDLCFFFSNFQRFLHFFL
jgi:hypothetical protein